MHVLSLASTVIPFCNLLIKHWGVRRERPDEIERMIFSVHSLLNALFAIC